MADMMMFPKTVDEFMEQYKIVDANEVYTNGAELVPIFRMKQWLEHIDAVEVVRCKDCIHNQLPPTRGNAVCALWYGMNDVYGYCHYGERREDE